MIEVRNLDKDYTLEGRTIKVLHKLDFRAEAGEKISIIGKSGVGKSTLLHVLGTLDEPTSGNVLYDGQDVFRFGEKRLAAFRNQSIGFVFQFHYLLPDFSALENVAMPCLIGNKKPAEARARAGEILAEVGLADRMSHRPGELSGGEQQRVAIARALVMNPKVLLADELTGNLDSGTSRGIHELLHRLNETHHTTIIVVTHDQHLADGMQKRYLLDEGRLFDRDATPVVGEVR